MGFPEPIVQLPNFRRSISISIILHFFLRSCAPRRTCVRRGGEEPRRALCPLYGSSNGKNAEQCPIYVAHQKARAEGSAIPGAITLTLDEPCGPGNGYAVLRCAAARGCRAHLARPIRSGIAAPESKPSANPSQRLRKSMVPG